MRSSTFGTGRTIVARLKRGGDLLEEIAAVAAAHGIHMAEFRGFGALQRATLAYYDQGAKTYHEHELPEPLEIVALLGNVSTRDGQMAVHAHVQLADETGRGFGGHVVPGCVVFACELFIAEVTGTVLERAHDDETGLPLWGNI
jgi:predicted DNA-binding protein with PD1-like motif